MKSCIKERNLYTSLHMETLLTILPWIQISLAVILTVAILIQQRGAGIGGAFGGSDESIHYERRGGERTLFNVTVVIAILFVLSTFVQMFITQSTTPDYVPTPAELETEMIDVEIEGDNVEGLTTEVIPNTELDALFDGEATAE